MYTIFKKYPIFDLSITKKQGTATRNLNGDLKMTTTNNTFAKTIELLEAFGVEKAVTVSRNTPSYGIKEDSENAYFASNMANGDKVIIVSDDVDLDGVFEDGKPQGVTIESDSMNDNYGARYYPVKRITFA